MAQVENLDKLADQIYQEGIEKANKESETIISKAQSKANKIIEDAEIKAKEIVQKSEKEAEKIKTSTLNEVKIKSKQAISDLKEEIESKFLSRNVNEKISGAFKDEDFIKELLLATTRNWSESDEMEIVLPEDLKKKIDSFLHKEINKKLSGTSIKTNNKMNNGFIIENTKEGYFISFKEEDFQEFLRPYFSERIRDILFQSNS